MGSFTVDRERFLVLASALASAHCGPAPAGPGALPPDPTATTRSAAPPTGSPVVVIEPTPEEPLPAPPLPPPVPPSSSSCDNDVGDVSCAFVDGRFRGPACEGFAGTCDLLREGAGYRPRVAEAIAHCFAQRGHAACNIRVRQRCIREAFDHACPDPVHEPFCRDAVDRCRAAGQRPDFDVDECVRALSATQPGDDLEWTKSAIGPTREGCRLTFTVY